MIQNFYEWFANKIKKLDEEMLERIIMKSCSKIYYLNEKFAEIGKFKIFSHANNFVFVWRDKDETFLVEIPLHKLARVYALLFIPKEPTEEEMLKYFEERFKEIDIDEFIEFCIECAIHGIIKAEILDHLVNYKELYGIVLAKSIANMMFESKFIISNKEYTIIVEPEELLIALFLYELYKAEKS